MHWFSPNMIRGSLLSCLIKNYKYCYRLCSKLPDIPNEPPISGLPPTRKPNVPFETIYDKFPNALRFYYFDGIPYVNALCKTNLISLPFATFFISGAVIDTINETISTEQCLVTAAMSVMYVLGHLASTSTFLHNFVGTMYIDEGTGEIIISYINFLGRRIDNKFEPNELYFKGRNSFWDKQYIYLISRKTNLKLKINLRYASIYSQELLENNFGKIPESAFD